MKGKEMASRVKPIPSGFHTNGVLTDLFGHAWSIATHKEDVTPEQAAKRAQAEFSAGAR
jgi:hypothetical protein